MSVPRLHDTNPVGPRSGPDSPDRFFSRRGLKSQNTPRAQIDTDPAVPALRPSLIHAPEPKLSSLYKRKQALFDPQDREAVAAKLRPARIRQDKEQLYEDALTLKMENNSLRGDNTRLRTRMNQLEKDLARKDEFLEELRGLSEEKQFSSVLAHSHLVAGLKQVNKDLRVELGAKEMEFERLKRSAKITKLAELETELKVYIEECQRLKDCLIDNPPEQTQQTKTQSMRHLEVENTELAGALTEAQVEIQRLSRHITDLEAQIRAKSELRNKGAEGSTELAEIQAKMKELESEKATKILEYANELEAVCKERADERTANKALGQQLEQAETDLTAQKTLLQGLEMDALNHKAETTRLLETINNLEGQCQQKSEFSKNLIMKTMKRKLIRRGVQLQDLIDRTQDQISVGDLKRILKGKGIKIKTWQLRGLVDPVESSLIPVRTLLTDLSIAQVKSVRKLKRPISVPLSIQSLPLIVIAAVPRPRDSPIPSIPIVSARFEPVEFVPKSVDRKGSSSSSSSSDSFKKAKPGFVPVQVPKSTSEESPGHKKERISSFSNSRKQSDSEVSDKEAFASPSPVITKGKETVEVYQEKPLFIPTSEKPESAQNPPVETERKSIGSKDEFPAEQREGEGSDFANEKPAETISPEALDMPAEEVLVENPIGSPEYLQEEDRRPDNKSDSSSSKDSGIASTPSNKRSSHDMIHPKSPSSRSKSSDSSRHVSDHLAHPESTEKQRFEIGEISPKSRDSPTLPAEIPRLDPVISATESAVEKPANFDENQEGNSDAFLHEDGKSSESEGVAEVFEYDVPEETRREEAVYEPEVQREVDSVPQEPEFQSEFPSIIKAEITVEDTSEKRGSVLGQPETETIHDHESATYIPVQGNPLDSQPSATGSIGLIHSPERDSSPSFEDVPDSKVAPPSLAEFGHSERRETDPQNHVLAHRTEETQKVESDVQHLDSDPKQQSSAAPSQDQVVIDPVLTAVLQPDPETLGRALERMRLSLQTHSIARSQLREVFLGVHSPEDLPIAIELEYVFERPPFDLRTDAIVLSRYMMKLRDKTTWGEVLQELETRLQDWEILGKGQEALRNQQLAQLFGQLSPSFLSEAESFERGNSECVSLAAFDSLLQAHDLRLEPGLKDYLVLISFTETKELDCVPYKKLKQAFMPHVVEPSGKEIEWKFSGDQQEALAKECALLLSTQLMDRGLTLRAVFQAKLKEVLTLEEFERGLNGLHMNEVVGEQTKALAEIVKTEEDWNLISIAKLEALLVHFGVNPFPSPRILT